MADGPQGVRNNTRSTMFPCGVAAAATWDRGRWCAIWERQVLGQDARARGVHIMLGPGVNIYRSPLCGRNFEYFKGEDPYLASETAVQYIEGMQSEGVMATIKHFAGNNQEWDRHQVSSDIDERTLHEIYLPAFRKAVEQAGVGASDIELQPCQRPACDRERAACGRYSARDVGLRRNLHVRLERHLFGRGRATGDSIWRCRAPGL